MITENLSIKELLKIACNGEKNDALDAAKVIVAQDYVPINILYNLMCGGLTEEIILLAQEAYVKHSGVTCDGLAIVATKGVNEEIALKALNELTSEIYGDDLTPNHLVYVSVNGKTEKIAMLAVYTLVKYKKTNIKHLLFVKEYGKIEKVVQKAKSSLDEKYKKFVNEYNDFVSSLPFETI